MVPTSYEAPRKFVFKRGGAFPLPSGAQLTVALYLGVGPGQWRQLELPAVPGKAEHGLTVGIEEEETLFFLRGMALEPSDLKFESDVRRIGTLPQQYLVYDAAWQLAEVVLQSPFSDSGWYYVQWRDSGGFGGEDSRDSVGAGAPWCSPEQGAWHAVQSSDDIGLVPELVLLVPRMHAAEYRVGFQAFGLGQRRPLTALDRHVRTKTPWRPVPLPWPLGASSVVWAQMKGDDVTVAEGASRARFREFNLVAADDFGGQAASLFLGRARESWEERGMQVASPGFVVKLAVRSSKVRDYFIRCPARRDGLVLESPVFKLDAGRASYWTPYSPSWEPVSVRFQVKPGTPGSVAVLWEDGRGSGWGEERAAYDAEAVTMRACLPGTWCPLADGKLTLYLSRFHPVTYRVSWLANSSTDKAEVSDWLALGLLGDEAERCVELRRAVVDQFGRWAASSCAAKDHQGSSRTAEDNQGTPVRLGTAD